jgi:hypothetical protein
VRKEKWQMHSKAAVMQEEGNIGNGAATADAAVKLCGIFSHANF